MKIGRLALEIWAFSLFVVGSTAVVHLGIVTSVADEHLRQMDLVATQLAETAWRERGDGPLGASPDDAAAVTVYDLDRTLVASTVSPPLELPERSELADLDERGHLRIGHASTAVSIRDPDGRVVGTGIVSFRLAHALPRALWPVAVLFPGLLVGAIVFARHLAGPLQHAAAVARAFGEGDLRARVRAQRADEIGEVGRAFDAMADRVTGLMAAQQQLLANVSHELRTPLARLQVAVDLVVDGKGARLEEVAPDIARDLAELQRLVDDVLTVARLDLARTDGSVLPLRLEQRPVGAVVEDAAERFRARHPARALEVRIEPGLPELPVDPVLLRRAVDNLLDNARKYSDDPSTIRLSAVCAGGGVRIAVADDGIGIDPADLPRVLEPFFRADRSRARATGGTGLGLALARQIAEAHGGRVEIESRLGSGTTVTLILTG